jgi:hypothetical protein
MLAAEFQNLRLQAYVGSFVAARLIFITESHCLTSAVASYGFLCTGKELNIIRFLFISQPTSNISEIEIHGPTYRQQSSPPQTSAGKVP